MDNKPVVGIIYKITNKVNNKVYIGQTSRNLETRLKQHIADAKNNRYNSLLHKAMNKYGFEKFDSCVIEKCYTKKELEEMEFHYIMQFKSFGEVYNLSINTYFQGGAANPNFGNRMSEESKNSISLKLKERYKETVHPWTGRKHTKETLKKISKVHKGRKHTKEARINMSKAQTGRIQSDDTKKLLSIIRQGDNNPMYGKKHSKDTRKNISKLTSGSSNPFYGKKHSEATREKMRVAWQKRKEREN